MLSGWWRQVQPQVVAAQSHVQPTHSSKRTNDNDYHQQFHNDVRNRVAAAWVRPPTEEFWLLPGQIPAPEAGEAHQQEEHGDQGDPPEPGPIDRILHHVRHVPERADT